MERGILHKGSMNSRFVIIGNILAQGPSAPARPSDFVSCCHLCLARHPDRHFVLFRPRHRVSHSNRDSPCALGYAVCRQAMELHDADRRKHAGSTVLQSGSTTLTLDKEAGRAILQRKLLFWKRKPVETVLSQIAEFTVDTAVDRASGIEICHTMVVMRNGIAWAFPQKIKRKRKRMRR
jgi:hypothetical protein